MNYQTKNRIQNTQRGTASRNHVRGGERPFLGVCGVFFVSCLTLLVFGFIHTTSAAPNYEINYQGKLTNASNVAVANDTYNIRFWLTTSPTIATTSAVWTEELTGTNKVQVTNGLFSIMLGSTTPLTGVDWSQTLYLGVEVGGTSTPLWDGEMSPRKILGTVPSAFEAENARTLDNLATTSLLRSDVDDTASGLLTFTGGLISNSSTTITNLTTDIATTTTLVIGNSPFTSLTGTGLTNTGGVLTATLGTDITTGEIADGDHGFFSYASGIASLDTNGLSSSNILSALTDETGTDNLVFSTNPLLSGFRSFASSTIGDGTGTGGLTVLGNSTTTGDAKISGGLAVAGITITDFQNINMSSGDAIQWGSSLTRLYGASATLNFITNSINRLFIGQYGNIGVGTTTPESSFVIQSASSTIPVLTVASTSGSSLLTVLGNGYVGIGTNAPTAELNIYKNNGSDDVTAYIQNGSASGGADAILRIGTTNSTGNPYVQYYTQGVAYWSAGMNSNSNKFVITPATDPTSAVINNSFYMTSVGMIGLGTSTPSSKLTIEQGMTGTGNLFQIASSSNGTATTTLFVVDQYGNVGIGTTSPSSLLAVQGLVTGANFFAYSTTSTTTLAGGLDVGNGGLVYDLESGETYIGSLISGTQTFDYDAGTVQWTDLPIWEAGLDTVQSYTASIGGNEMLTIYGLSSGASTTYNNMVGIGSSTPSRFLTVAGDSYFTNNITAASSTLGYATSTSLYTAAFGLGSDYITDLTGTGLSVTNGVLNVTGDGLSNWLTLNGALTPSTTLGIRINASSTIGDGTGAGGLTILGNSTTTGSASVIGSLTAASMTVTSGSTYSLGDKVALTNSGGVMSIGSSAIWTGLTFGPGATPRMSIDSSGNVGIGTSTPLSTLTIQGSGTTNPFTIASSTGASMFSVNSIGQVTVPGVIIANGGILGSDALYLDGRFGANVNINSIWKGNVGIGTSSPTASLFVQGASSTIPVLNVASSTGASLFTVLANGSVGIGSSTPVAKLSVVGTGGSSNVFAFASSTGSNLLTLGADGRMVFGNNASADIFLNGGKTTENPQSNQNNVAIGNGAFTYYTSDATHNTALGYQALRGSSTVPMTGGFNFAVGSFALLTNTTGSFNNAFGYQALYSNTTGSSNNALGNSALISNTTGSNNNAFGSSALYTNTTGSNNNALGKSALNNNTTGTNNNVLGFVALLNNTTGSNNIAIGGGVQFDSGVLYNNTTGSGNIGLGFQAGDTITTGNSNVFLGHIADASADNLSTSTAIGAGAVVGCSNCLVLGGTGVNYVNVGIGTTSPNARLTVRGTGTTNPFLVASSTGSTSLAVLATGDVEVPGNIISAGINWTTRTAASTTVGYESIIYGNGRFVAVGSKVAMTSSDGINWATSTPATDSYWGDITYGNGLFVAVGTTTPGIDRVMTSPDGITWTARSAAGNDDNWNAITYGNGLFVAVGNTGDRVMTSPDGITWTARPAVGDDDNWRAITYGNGLFVAVGSSGDRVMTSPDGISWVAQSASGDDDLWASITYGNGLFVVGGLPAFAGNSMITSPDGITWTERSVAGDNDYWVTIAYGNGLFVAMSYFFGNPEGIITSPDGINWTVRSALASSDRWNSVAYGNGMFVGVGIQASGNQRSVITSGKTFTNALATNNTYQGGMSVLGGTFNIGTTTPTTSPLYGLNVLNVASTSGSSLLTISNSGNVGIGSSTPARTLSVTGDSSFSGIANFTDLLATNATTTNLAITGKLYDGAGTAGTNGYILQTTGAGVQWVSTTTLGFGGGSIADGMSNWLTLNGALTPSTTLGIRINASSTIGDGTGAGGLTILGNSTTTGSASVIGSLTAASMAVTSGSTYSLGDKVALTNGGTTMNIGSSAIWTGLTFGPGATPRMSIDSSGNVGIGTTTPASTLTIQGSGTTNPFTIASSTGSNLFSINSSGILDIRSGTSTQASTNIFVNGGSATTTVLRNIALGFDSFINVTSGANDNIAFGYQALYGSSTAKMTGSYNFVAGSGAGYLNTTGSSNTFIGFMTGRNNTVGSSNAFIGNMSGLSNTTGSNNTFIGELAGTGNTTGSSNFFNGLLAGWGNNEGSHNIFIGENAGQNNNVGSHNIAQGYQAFLGNESGAGNIAQGYQALFYNSYGSYNIASGYYSGSNLGSYATSSGNIFIGAYAGQGQTLGDNNIFIGYDSSVASTTGSNQLSIGNLIYGLNTATGANVATGTVGIGTTTPQSTLTIQGSGTTNPFAVASSSGSSMLTVLANGNVGIGSSTPVAKLSVTGTGGSSNVFAFASSTGSNILTLGADGRMIFGNNASADIFLNGGKTTANPQSNQNNVAIGNQAFTYYTSGSATYNTAIGYQALYGSSTVPMTGQNNFAVGYQSLFNNTTGSENFSMGYNSLFSNTTGSRNIAIGSGYSAASGPSLQFNTTGSDNIALGVQSLANNTSGNANIAMGNSNALFSNITGGYNIAFGQSALSQSVSGSENISIGRYSGYLLGDTATSSGNTFLGAYAGQTQTRGNNNIFIGYDSSVASTTGSNQLSIGNLLYGTNLASGATVSTGTIGIGTSSPRSTLTIQGSGTTNPFAIASSSGSSMLTVLANGNVGLGTSTPLALLNLDRRSLTGSVVGGMKQYLSYINSTESAVYYGDESYFLNTPTATSTFVGKMIRIEDTSTLGNTVRGLEAQAFRGTNTKGENTGLSGFGRTFGVRGTTLGDAGSVFVPAGVFADSQGTTQGNALRAYSGTLTTEDLVSFFHDGSTFSGTGLSMNFGNSGGSFAATSSAKFLDLQVGGTSKFTVTAAGTTTIGDGTTANMAGLQIGFGGLCVDNDGACTASTTGRITSVSSASGNSDLAEMYFSSDALEAGEIVSLVGGLSVGRASGASADAVIGVISTKPGLIMGFDDTSLVAGETAYPVALKGRVPIKLSTENGPIMKGDRIALSSIPGIGMKAHDGDTVVGIALEDYSGEYAYSAGYLNQFGDDLVKAKMQARSQETDARTQDGCSYGGGNAQGEAQCVKDKVAPIKPVTVSVDTRTEALRVLRAEEATRAQTTGGQEVTIGQAVMFVHLHDFVSRGGRDILAELSATTSVIDGNGTETLWDRVKTLAQNFVDGVLRVTGIKTEELCVGSVCVDEATFLRMVENAGGSQTGGDTDAGGEDVTTDEGGSGDSEGSPVEETPPQEDPMPPSEDPAPVIESPVEEPPAEPVQEEVPPEPEPAPLETPQEPAPEVPAV